jgi:hypothetical protein
MPHLRGFQGCIPGNKLTGNSFHLPIPQKENKIFHKQRQKRCLFLVSAGSANGWTRLQK